MSALTFSFLSILALAVGALIPIQAASNAALSKALGSYALVALILFAVGFIFVSCWILLTRPEFPPISSYRNAPIYGYLGGIIVASYVLAITFIAPKLGVGNAICFIVTGQILAAVIIDHYGLFGSIVHHFTWQRLLGVLLMVIGLFLAKKA